MTVISVSIVESSEQVISGIPKMVSVSTNIPATIFYTIDGTIPTNFSNIYIGPIFLPFDKLSVTLNILASNGINSSPILTEIYSSNILNDTRLPHSSTDVQPGTNIPDLYPFGTNIAQPLGTYLNPGEAGTNVFDPSLPSTGTGFVGDGYVDQDGYISGTETGFTNKPFTLQNYNIIYSTSDVEGNTGPGIGNLPANVTIKPQDDQPEESDQFSNFFDPRALVIFQDVRKENPADPPIINSMSFTFENPEKARDGNAFFTSGLDSPPNSGSFVSSFYNARENTVTSYYFDSWANKWLIMTAPFVQNGTYDGNLSQVFRGRDTGTVGIVIEWNLYARRVLF